MPVVKYETRFFRDLLPIVRIYQLSVFKVKLALEANRWNSIRRVPRYEYNRTKVGARCP